ncbi:MAG: TolC family protein [Gemmatimonadales bacterium]|nr:TolC family protein [Gemmatimonadales bacterium]
MPILVRHLVALSVVTMLGVGEPHQFVVTASAQDTVTVSLPELVDAALEHALTLRGGRLNVTVAEAGVLSARSTFDPLLQANADLDRSGVSGSSPGPFEFTSRGRKLTTGVAGTLPISTQYSVSLNSTFRSPQTDATGNPLGEYDNTLSVALTQPLLRGFGSAGGAAQLAAAGRSLQAAEARLTRLVEETIATVEIRYWTLAQTEEAEAVAAQSLERAQILLQRNEELRRLDKINEVALITSQVGVATRRNSLLQATQRRQDALDDLVFFVYGAGAAARLRALGVFIQTDRAPVQIPRLPALDGAIATALVERNDLVAARQDAEAIHISARVSGNALLPTLNLTAAYTATVNNADAIRFSAGAIGTQSTGWSVGASALFPLFNSQARATHRELNSLADQQDFAVLSVENVVRNDVRQTMRGIEIGTQSLAVADSALRLALRQYDMERQRLELGLSESFRLLQFEDQVANSETAEIAARYALAIAVTRYQLAAGSALLMKYGLAAEGRSR